MDAHRRQSPDRGDGGTSTVDEQALERFVQLGDLHRAADSIGEALQNFTAGLGVLADAGTTCDPRTIDLHMRVADCRLLRGELNDARAALADASAVRAHFDARRRAMLRGYHGILAGMIGDYPAALERLDQALGALDGSTDAADVSFRARLFLHKGAAEERLGKTARAGHAFQEALRLYQSVDDRRGIAHAYNNLGLNRKQENRLREAITFLHRALEVLDEVGDYGRKAPTCLNLGLIYTRIGEWKQARGQLTRALQIAREVDNRGRVIRALLALGSLQLRARELADARTNLEEADALAQRHEFRREHVLAREFLGEVALAEGRASHALSILDAALIDAREVAAEGDLVMEILRRRADAYLALGDHAHAARAAQEAIAAALALGDVTEAAAARRVFGICQLRTGKDDAARASLDEALSVFGELGIRFEEARTHLVAASARLETAGDKGRDAAIDASLEAARPLFEALGVPGYLAELLHVACEDRIRTGELEEAESVWRIAGRYVAASDEHGLAEHQMRLKRRLDEAVGASVASSDVFSPGRELHRLFREGVDVERATRALVEMVQRRTSSDRVALAKGPDADSLTVVAASGGSEDELAAVLKRLDSVVRTSMRRGLPAIRREDPSATEGAPDVCGYAVAPLCLPNDIWGVLYIDRKPRSVVGPYRPSDLNLIGLLAELASISVLALERNRALGEAAPNGGNDYLSRIVYRSRAMEEIIAVVRKVAKSPASVLLRGETGTGKGLIARAVHELGPRRGRPFVAINCAAIPETLLESELFGHVSGAFTGAVRTKRGLFEEAEGGTIFLDEVDKAAKTVQGKLLHVLDHQEIRPVGANRWKRVDARVVSATNADLRTLIARGEFLEDLYYRLNDIAIHIPPLRERADDVEPLVRHFAERFRRETGRDSVTFAPHLIERLVGHRWQGNVRELEKVVRGLVTMSDEGESIDTRHLPPDLQQLAALRNGASGERTLRESVKAVEREVIERALAACDGNKSAVSRKLKVSYPTLLTKIREYDLEPRR